MEKEKNNCEKTRSSVVVKNIIIVAISNLLKLISGVLIGFLIPKIMGDTNYGFYKTFTLYCGYVGLLHFGFNDGIYLLIAGTKYDDLKKEDFRLFSRFLIYFQSIIAGIICIVSLFFIGNDYGFIFFFLGITLLATNVTNYYQFISQITGRFKELSFRNIVQAILQAVSVIVLWSLYHFGYFSILNYKIYIVIYACIVSFLAVWYMITYRNITFGHKTSFSKQKHQIFVFFKVGFPLMIANLVSGLILTVDKQFVNILATNGIYTMAEFGVYSFAYNMLALITTVISAISVVLYPTIKSYDVTRLKSDYSRLVSIISILTAFCLLSYQPLCFIVDNWLEQYTNSLEIFRAILPGVILSSCVTMIMFNYYKALGIHSKFFAICLVILVLALGADFIAFFATGKMVWISYVSVIVLGVWYLVTEAIIVRKIHVNPLKNIIYNCLIISSFYLITYFINNIYWSFLVYFGIVLIVTFIMNFDLIKQIIKKRRSNS